MPAETHKHRVCLPSIESANARKPRQIGLCSPQNGNRKKLGQLRKLCQLGGVLPRPIEIPCPREDPSAYFRGPFFRGALFSRNPENRRFGAICGGLMA